MNISKFIFSIFYLVYFINFQSIYGDTKIALKENNAPQSIKKNDDPNPQIKNK